MKVLFCYFYTHPATKFSERMDRKVCMWSLNTLNCNNNYYQLDTNWHEQLVPRHFLSQRVIFSFGFKKIITTYYDAACQDIHQNIHSYCAFSLYLFSTQVMLTVCGFLSKLMFINSVLLLILPKASCSNCSTGPETCYE